MLNSSEVTVLTNEQTHIHKQRDLFKNIYRYITTLCYASGE